MKGVYEDFHAGMKVPYKVHESDFESDRWKRNQAIQGETRSVFFPSLKKSLCLKTKSDEPQKRDPSVMVRKRCCACLSQD